MKFNFKLILHYMSTAAGYIIGVLFIVLAMLVAIKLVILSARWLFG